MSNPISSSCARGGTSITVAPKRSRGRASESWASGNDFPGGASVSSRVQPRAEEKQKGNKWISSKSITAIVLKLTSSGCLDSLSLLRGRLSVCASVCHFPPFSLRLPDAGRTAHSDDNPDVEEMGVVGQGREGGGRPGEQNQRRPVGRWAAAGDGRSLSVTHCARQHANHARATPTRSLQAGILRRHAISLRYSSAKKIPRWKRLIRLFISKLHFLSCKIFLELFPVIFLLSQYWLNYFLLYIFSEFHSKLLFSG